MKQMSRENFHFTRKYNLSITIVDIVTANSIGIQMNFIIKKIE